MTSQINRKRLPSRPADESPGAERFGVHTFGSFLRHERLAHGMPCAVPAANSIEMPRLAGFEANAFTPTLPEIGRLAEALGTAKEVIIREAGMIRG